MDHRFRTGHLVALLGAAVTAASLWLPWYEIRLGELARGALGAQAQQLPGGAGDLARGLAKLLPDSVSGNGWEVLQGADSALIAAAVLGAALMLAAGGLLGPGVRVDAATAGRLAGTIGSVAAVIAIKHAVSVPGPDGLISVRLGVWAAVAGGVLMALGGWSLASQRDPAPVAAAPVTGLAFAPPIDDHGALAPVGASVAPPSVAPPPGR